jgi:site-specific DNA-methyltransferase (adenine-specific)
MLNQLYYGDNLEILRKYIPDNSIDLIYLDPPFNSKADYNIIFKEINGNKPISQIKAFSDFWHWDANTQNTYEELMNNPKYPEKLKRLIGVFDGFLGRNDLFAYLVMLSIRLVELRRVLKDTGLLYLHCDQTASHYIKLVLDAIFNPKNFRNEIIWKKSNSPKVQSRGFGTQHDSLFLYSKGPQSTYNPVKREPDANYLKSFSMDDNDGRGPYQSVALVAGGMQRSETRKVFEFKGITAAWLYSPENLEKFWNENRIIKTKSGYRLKVYLKNLGGPSVSDIWDDKEVSPLQGQSKELLGYPTQKPLALLERIIKASSNEDDLVLDPFCGCGTTLDAAEKLHRRWIGIDITHIAIHVIKKRLTERYPDVKFEIIGEPEDLESARELALQDRFQFQLWALSLVNATPSERKSGDRGIDGVIYSTFLNKNYYGIVQIKSGTVGVKDIRDFRGTLEREKADFGIFVTLDEPTEGMKAEAVVKGSFNTEWGEKIPIIQIATINDLLNGVTPKLPAPPNNYNVATKGKRKGKEPLQATMDEIIDKTKQFN